MELFRLGKSSKLNHSPSTDKPTIHTTFRFQWGFIWVYWGHVVLSLVGWRAQGRYLEQKISGCFGGRNYFSLLLFFTQEVRESQGGLLHLIAHSSGNDVEWCCTAARKRRLESPSFWSFNSLRVTWPEFMYMFSLQRKLSKACTTDVKQWRSECDVFIYILIKNKCGLWGKVQFLVTRGPFLGHEECLPFINSSKLELSMLILKDSLENSMRSCSEWVHLEKDTK